MSEINVGEWYRNKKGDVRRCAYTINHDSYRARFLMEWDDGSAGFVEEHEVGEHLPDCTGFDWKPPKRPDAPSGWRWLEDDEPTKIGDNYWAKENPRIPDLVSGAGRKWKDIKSTFGKIAWGIIRKIEPKYRAFATAEEFKPHFDRPVYMENSKWPMRITGSVNQGVFIGRSLYTWGEAFEKFNFDDRLPFGVRVDD